VSDKDDALRYLEAVIRKEIARELFYAEETTIRSLAPGFMAAAYKLDPSLKETGE
jgi:hypothetical protein